MVFVSWLVFLLAAFGSTGIIAAGLPGRDAIVVTPGQDGLDGDADAASQGTIDDERGWTGGLRLRYFGPRALIEDNSQRSQSSMLVNAKLGYAFYKQVRLNAEVLNLTNNKVNDIEYFYASRLPGEPVDGVADRHVHPAEPRTLRVSLTLRF